MSLRPTKTLDDFRWQLAQAFGFPDCTIIGPYLTYIVKNHIGGSPREDWIELFIDVINHFQRNAGSIQTLIDKYTLHGHQSSFSNTKAGELDRRKDVEDTVLYILGTWCTMFNSFVRFKGQSRRVTSAYKLFAETTTAHNDPFSCSLAELISGSGLLPGGRWDRNMDVEGDTTTRLLKLILSSSSLPNQLSPYSSRPYSSGSNSTLLGKSRSLMIKTED